MNAATTFQIVFRRSATVRRDSFFLGWGRERRVETALPKVLRTLLRLFDVFCDVATGFVS
jgi:hypothetical protein